MDMIVRMSIEVVVTLDLVASCTIPALVRGFGCCKDQDTAGRIARTDNPATLLHSFIEST